MLADVFDGPRTYGTTASTAITASTSAAASTATTRWLTLIALFSILSLHTACSSTIGLLGVLLGLARKLDRDLAIEDLLARELSDGTLSLAWGREVDKGIAYRAVGARVLWDRGGFTAGRRNVSLWFQGELLHIGGRWDGQIWDANICSRRTCCDIDWGLLG